MNTLVNTIAYEGDAPDDVEFLTRQFEISDCKLYVGDMPSGYEKAPWRCGHPKIAPTFGMTRREAVENMLVKLAAIRLK